MTDPHAAPIALAAAGAAADPDGDYLHRGHFVLLWACVDDPENQQEADLLTQILIR